MPHPSFGNRCSPFTFGQITKRCLMNVLSNLTCWALHGYIARICWCKETVYQLLSYYYKPSCNQTWQWTIPIYKCSFFHFNSNFYRDSGLPPASTSALGFFSSSSIAPASSWQSFDFYSGTVLKLLTYGYCLNMFELAFSQINIIYV